MARLTYSMMASLDGYVTDPNGAIDWILIDEELHRFTNDEERNHGLDIYGRRMYEMMVYWDTADQLTDRPQYENDFARIWKSIDKIVVSSSLDNVTATNTRLQRSLSPDDMRKLKAESAKDIAVSGPTIASTFINAGLVDEFSVYVMPVILGGGTPFFKDVKVHLDLELTEEHRFQNGAVFLRYRTRGGDQ